MIIAPSLLSANFTNLHKDIEMINQSLADLFHIDVMDGMFVPNISFGQPIVRQIKSISQKPLDVHLMIANPERYIESFKKCGADILTIHSEACIHLSRTLNHIKELGMKASVAINPHTPVKVLENVIEICDMVLIMSVNPGFGGQSFIENTYRKLDQINILKNKFNPSLLIQVDGGVNLENAQKLFDSGVNVLVAGHSIFSNENPKLVIQQLKEIQ